MSTKYRVMFYPWLRREPYVVEKLTENGEWEGTPLAFRDLGEADDQIARMKKGPYVAREFEL